jgi:hypothetical protein
MFDAYCEPKRGRANLGVDTNDHLGMHPFHDVWVSGLSEGDDETVFDTDVGLERRKRINMLRRRALEESRKGRS